MQTNEEFGVWTRWSWRVPSNPNHSMTWPWQWGLNYLEKLGGKGWGAFCGVPALLSLICSWNRVPVNLKSSIKDQQELFFHKLFINCIFKIILLAFFSQKDVCLSNKGMICPLFVGNNLPLSFGPMTCSLSSFNVTAVPHTLDPRVWGLVLSTSWVCCGTQAEDGGGTVLYGPNHWHPMLGGVPWFWVK